MTSLPDALDQVLDNFNDVIGLIAQQSQEDAVAIVRRVVDGGINYAANYSPAEESLVHLLGHVTDLIEAESDDDERSEAWALAQDYLYKRRVLDSVCRRD